jgi:hypothetical protein
MIARRFLLRGSAVLALLVVATSIMAIITIQLVVSSSRAAYGDLARDLQGAERVDRGLRRLTDASRAYVTRPDDLQRVRLARIQRELEPEVDVLIARARVLQVPTAAQIDTNTDRFVGWLALAVAEQTTLEAFEQMLATWRPIVQVDLNAFVSTAESHGRDSLAEATGLSRRATLGIIVLSALALLTSAALMAHVLRRSSNNVWRSPRSFEVPHA